MTDNLVVEHFIQKFILSKMMRQKNARFSELRPPRVDSNAFSYHLKLLQKNNFIMKCDGGYTLSFNGLRYVDRVSIEQMQVRPQPKIITMMVVQDGYGKVLLQKRVKQPYIDTWTLVYGKLHLEDPSVLYAAHREFKEKTGVTGLDFTHAGDAYLRVSSHGEQLSTTLAHVFYAQTDEPIEGEDLIWCDPRELHTLMLAPCVEAIIGRTFFRDPFYFEEFLENWRS